MSKVTDYLNEFYNKFAKDNSIEPDTLFQNKKSNLIFRGQANSYWNIESSAGRRLKSADKTTQNEFIQYHVNLISNARKYSEFQTTAEQTDLDILANIQHYGGATCLTDFTTNFLIALWMASEDKTITELDVKGKDVVKGKEPGERANGRIIWLDLDEEVNFNNISYYNRHKEGDSIEHLLKKRAENYDLKKIIQPRFWLWEPLNLNKRIIKQDSVFLFGLSAFPENSSRESRLYFDEIIIKSDDKKDIRQELEQIFGICAESLYYDLSGYSNNANASEKPISQRLLNNRSCLNKARDCIKREQYSIALNYINDALACIENQQKNGKKTNKCKRTSEKACLNFAGELFYLKGTVFEDMKKDDDSLLNYYESKKRLISDLKIIKSKKNENNENQKTKLEKLLCESYRKQSIILYKKEDYTNAFITNKSLYIQYIKNERNKQDKNGVDGLFALLELSIFTFNQNEFHKTLERLKDERNLSVIGEILICYLKTVGKIIFDRKIDISNDINALLKKLDDKKPRNSNDKLVGYFHWDYEDMIKWFSKIKKNYRADLESESKEFKKVIFENHIYLNLFAQKAAECQNKWINNSYVKNYSVNE